ncbi:hypothetical protein ACFPAF_16375 [Hymenobacter endophyticus]|uniref:Uncharacterized protein n=1 Tax=Hymenobacter endophyticus TaxID=3076335 RepID=A0ABU3TKS9_9BACT|nr:hypothetical protein [Hymenobacter endophyticus]MDU0371979.1 hypothetical protein [Hymenobacter endophyticus]
MDFFTFSQQARKRIYNLNVDVCMYEKETALGVGIIMYRLKVQGMAIGPEPLTTESASGEDCITNMIARVCRARRQQKDLHRGQQELAA